MAALPKLIGAAARLGRGVALATAVGALVGAGPAPDGTEVTVGAAYGRYTTPSAGCGSLDRRYRVLEPAVDAHVRHRFDRGWTASVGGSVAPGVASIPGNPDLEPDLAGSYVWSGAAAVQGGRHGQWAGVQAGPAVVARPGAEAPQVLPSGELWVGRPDRVYGWAALLPLPHTGALELAALGGIGHRSDRVHLEAGTSGAGWLGRAGVRAGAGVWLHAELAGGRWTEDQELADLRGRVAFTVLPRALRAGAAAPAD